MGAHYALAASPARYAVEGGDWEGAGQLPVRPAQLPVRPEQLSLCDGDLALCRSAWGCALRPAGCCQTRYRIAKLAELRAKEALAAFEATKARTASGASWAQGNAGRFEVEHPGDYATLNYPTNPATAPEAKMPSSLN